MISNYYSDLLDEIVLLCSIIDEADLKIRFGQHVARAATIALLQASTQLSRRNKLFNSKELYAKPGENVDDIKEAKKQASDYVKRRRKEFNRVSHRTSQNLVNNLPFHERLE